MNLKYPYHKAFTLLELIIVIIIVGLLATLGLTQYTSIVERGRTAEARVSLGYMRKLANEYYLKNGSLTSIQLSDVGVGSTTGLLPSSCTSSFYFRYAFGGSTSEQQNFDATRCTSGGKSPNASRGYVYYMEYYPATSQAIWRCYWTDEGTVYTDWCR